MNEYEYQDECDWIDCQLFDYTLEDETVFYPNESTIKASPEANLQKSKTDTPKNVSANVTSFHFLGDSAEVKFKKQVKQWSQNNCLTVGFSE